MTDVLVFESSTENGSVAVVRDGDVASEVRFAARDHITGARTESLAPSVAEALAAAALEARDLEAVICSAGPGGFTSLRSAAAIAKGICSATGAPLYGVSSLTVLAWSAAAPKGRYIAAIAAGRDEWFAMEFATATDGTIELSCEFIAKDPMLRERAARDHASLVGAGLEIQAVPRASAIARYAGGIIDGMPVDLDAWEPSYGRLAEAQVKWEAAHGRPLSL